MEHIGIDYGSKMAGTTAIAFSKRREIHFEQSIKKKDADTFLLVWIDQHQPRRIFLDAPLSLPRVYTQPDEYEDYFYRAGDRELKAMSPMFLGGLTARAMKLSRQLQDMGSMVFETYPSQMSTLLSLDKGRYKKDKSYLPIASGNVMDQLPGYTLPEPPLNWHQFDALLAFCSGWRFRQGEHQVYGEPGEGSIVV